MRLLFLFVAIACLFFGVCFPTGAQVPPPPLREFRGLWVATVNNIDWPSRAGLSTPQQQAELTAILDAALALHFNAVFLQVRPDCDALYESQIEPWSEYLTGAMGRAPFPYYDPLDFAVAEAHKRGIELHAWINPFRVRSLDLKTAVSHNFITHRHPEMVRRYGKYLWLDPTLQETREYCLRVVADLVHRYDIDGIHFDDYFYPYREKVDNREIEFPDDQSWSRYRATGGKLGRNDWRRDNINEFIQSVYAAIKAERPWVKFGVSPFGIWRPQHPVSVKGLDSYDVLFSDSRLWLEKGWVDYLAPQLYWPVDSKDQNFGALLQWWSEQNSLHRHLWPGIKVGGWPGIPANRDAHEVIREIEATRSHVGVTGNILWHTRPLFQTNTAVAPALLREVYMEPALAPASPWLSTSNPPAPLLTVKLSGDSFKLKWKSATDYDPWQWVLEKKVGARWITEVYPPAVHETTFLAPQESLRPSAIALAAVNRYGNLSPWSLETPTNSAVVPTP